MAAYVAVGSEPGTAPLLHALLAAGKRVMLPVLLPGRRPGLGGVRRRPGPRARRGCGLLEPVGRRLGADAVATADVVLVPGLAVSARGERLGRGGGSYDRALGRVPVGTFTCVLLHDDEVGVDVPVEPHDRPVDRRRASRRESRGSPRRSDHGTIWQSTRSSASPARGVPCPPTSTPARECGHAFEQVQSFSDDALTECPECEGRLRKVFNAVGVVFKGSGFYRTDSRGKESSSETAASPAKTDVSASQGDAKTRRPRRPRARRRVDSGSSGSSGSTTSTKSPQPTAG